MKWGAGAGAGAGYVNEYLGSFGLGPFDQPGGRIMGDTTTLWIVEMWELWRQTGDFAFLSTWWPSIIRALQWQSGAACMNGPLNQGLPFKLVCTYDIINFSVYNATSFNSLLHLSAMKAGVKLAAVMGDAATGALCEAAFATGQQAMRNLLWNSTSSYYRAYTGGDAVMGDCTYGALIGLHNGLGWVNPSANTSVFDPVGTMAAHLSLEMAANTDTYGLKVVTGRHTPPPAARKGGPSHRQRAKAAAAISTLPAGGAERLGLTNDGEDDVDWMGAGPDWSYMALQVAAAQARAGGGSPYDPLPAAQITMLLEPALRSMGNWRSRLSDMWNIAGITTPADWTSSKASNAARLVLPTTVTASPSLPAGSTVHVAPSDPSATIEGMPYVTSHYGFLLTDYFLLPGLTGQQADIASGSLMFNPLYACPYALPLLLPGTTGTLTCAPGPAYTVTLAFGSLSLPAGGLVVSGLPCPKTVQLGQGESVAWA